jgi:hypothetical protein
MNELTYLINCFFINGKEIFLLGINILNQSKIIYYAFLFSFIYPVIFSYINEHKIKSLLLGTVFFLLILKKDSFMYFIHRIMIKKHMICDTCHDGNINHNYLIIGLAIILLPIVIIDGLAIVYKITCWLKNKCLCMVVKKMPLEKINNSPKGLITLYIYQLGSKGVKYIIKSACFIFYYSIYLLAFFYIKGYKYIKKIGKWAQIKIENL